jgi:hypothetical protein
MCLAVQTQFVETLSIEASCHSCAQVVYVSKIYVYVCICACVCVRTYVRVDVQMYVAVCREFVN